MNILELQNTQCKEMYSLLTCIEKSKLSNLLSAMRWETSGPLFTHKVNINYNLQLCPLNKCYIVIHSLTYMPHIYKSLIQM